jgi:hypothetical protein
MSMRAYVYATTASRGIESNMHMRAQRVHFMSGGTWYCGAQIRPITLRNKAPKSSPTQLHSCAGRYTATRARFSDIPGRYCGREGEVLEIKQLVRYFCCN